MCAIFFCCLTRAVTTHRGAAESLSGVQNVTWPVGPKAEDMSVLTKNVAVLCFHTPLFIVLSISPTLPDFLFWFPEPLSACLGGLKDIRILRSWPRVLVPRVEAAWVLRGFWERSRSTYWSVKSALRSSALSRGGTDHRTFPVAMYSVWNAPRL